MPAHTPREAVIAAANQARAARTDLIVTVGGGSITDGAKAVQICLANDVSTVEGIDTVRVRKGEAPPMQPPVVRQISVPTTIAGGEFSHIAGVTNERTKVKEMLRHELVIPRAAILDPFITVHTPEWLFLSTGIRAVDHCVEGICSGEANPYGDAQALHGLMLLSRGLPRVKADPSDLEARLDCQIGSWLSMAPLAAGVPMGASHGIGYVLGAEFDVPHGYTSCVMLPAVMRWNPDPDDVQRSVIKLVLTLVELIRKLMERQAIRRMDERTLTAAETEAVGKALMEIERTIRDIGTQFDLAPEDLNLDLGTIKLL